MSDCSPSLVHHAVTTAGTKATATDKWYPQNQNRADYSCGRSVARTRCMLVQLLTEGRLDDFIIMPS